MKMLPGSALQWRELETYTERWPNKMVSFTVQTPVYRHNTLKQTNKQKTLFCTRYR